MKVLLKRFHLNGHTLLRMTMTTTTESKVETSIKVIDSRYDPGSKGERRNLSDYIPRPVSTLAC